MTGNLDLHIALLFGTQDRLALVVEGAAGKASYLQQVCQLMVLLQSLNPGIRRALSSQLIFSPGSRLAIFLVKLPPRAVA